MTDSLLSGIVPKLPVVNKEAVVQVLSEGQCIKHIQYGFGIVAESDVERTTIDFDSVGTKKFVTSLMTMELVGEAPERPTKPSRRSRAGAVSRRQWFARRPSRARRAEVVHSSAKPIANLGVTCGGYLRGPVAGPVAKPATATRQAQWPAEIKFCCRKPDIRGGP